MADNATTTTEQAAPLTAESIATIIDSRINNFVHSQKTDIAKMREQLTGVSTALESVLKPKETATTQEATPTPATTTDPKISVLERQIKELQATNTAALEKAARADRDSALNKVLSGFQFANETARD